MHASLLFPALVQCPLRFLVSCLSQFAFALFLFSPAGCNFSRQSLDNALRDRPGAGPADPGVTENYTLACPDELEVVVAGRPEATGKKVIGPDGRIELGRAGTVRVEGQTPAEATVSVGKQLRVPPGKVRLRVATFKSKLIYLSGEGTGVPRSVPYEGPETVLELLHRVGGIAPGAAVGEVYVVRPHVAEGDRPEVFHVDLQGIVMKKDQHTNLRLQPFDQVYVGESRQGKLDKCLPPCLRPIHQTIWGLEPRKRPYPPLPPPN
jgi:protein involved in polysaccharide export with SLBB domain